MKIDSKNMRNTGKLKLSSETLVTLTTKTGIQAGRRSGVSCGESVDCTEPPPR